LAPPRHDPRLLAAAAILVGLVLALGLAELGLRAWETWRRVPVVRGEVDTPKALHTRTAAGKRITPHLDTVIRAHPTSRRDVRVRTNHLGLRGPEVGPKRDGELRVLVLGDSITFADYVDEAETYPARLEALLTERRGGRTVIVVNAGGPNVGTRDEAALLAELAPALRPDLVLVGFYLNDSLGQIPYPDVIHLPAWISWSRVVKWASVEWAKARHRQRVGSRYRWTEEFLARRWVTDRAAFERVITLADGDWGAAWHDWAWPAVEEGLTRMLTLGRTYGFGVAVAVFPVSVQVESRFEDDRPQQRMRALAAQLGLPFLDLLPVLRAAAEQRLFYDQCHLTPLGNALAGRAMAPFVEQAAAGR
jgi:hypothetical protein